VNRLEALARDDGRLGRFLTVLGISGLVAVLVAGVLGIGIVVALGNSMERSLAVTADAVTAADDTVALAAETIGVVSDSFDTLVPSAELAASAFDDANTVFGDTVEVVTVDVPDGLDAVVDALPAIERVAAIIDNTLGFLSFVGVDYNPEVPFDEAVSELEVAIGDLPQQLRDQAEPLASLQEDFASFGTAAADIAGDLAALQTQLDEAQDLLDTYADTTEAATVVIDDIRSALEWQRWLALFVVVLVTAALAGLQVVPILLGRRFLGPGTRV